jgi:hypothetical protein
MNKCKNCGNDNPGNNNYCIVCGNPLSQDQTVVCRNGHVYNSSLPKCPYCPSSEIQNLMGVTKTMSSSSNDAAFTIPFNSSDSSDKTKVIGQDANFGGSNVKNNPKDGRTVIIQEDKESGFSSEQKGRKLVGWLVCFTWNPYGDDYKLYEGRNIITGEGKGDIIINDPAISSPHCTILYRENKFKIKDEFSTNGTRINNNSIEESELQDGDIIKIGRSELLFKKI